MDKTHFYVFNVDDDISFEGFAAVTLSSGKIPTLGGWLRGETRVVLSPAGDPQEAARVSASSRVDDETLLDETLEVFDDQGAFQGRYKVTRSGPDGPLEIAPQPRPPVTRPSPFYPDEVYWEEPQCWVCGCTDNHACEGGCWWVPCEGDDLCSSCEDQLVELDERLMDVLETEEVLQLTLQLGELGLTPLTGKPGLLWVSQEGYLARVSDAWHLHLTRRPGEPLEGEELVAELAGQIVRSQQAQHNFTSNIEGVLLVRRKLELS